MTGKYRIRPIPWRKPGHQLRFATLDQHGRLVNDNIPELGGWISPTYETIAEASDWLHGLIRVGSIRDPQRPMAGYYGDWVKENTSVDAEDGSVKDWSKLIKAI